VVKLRSKRWIRHIESTGETKDAFKIFVGKPEGERPLERPRRKREDNIKIDLKFSISMWTGFIWLRIGYGNGFL
jgi:hypothetical protein